MGSGHLFILRSRAYYTLMANKQALFLLPSRRKMFKTLGFGHMGCS